MMPLSDNMNKIPDSREPVYLFYMSSEAQIDENDPYVKFFDNRFSKSREFLIFMEETKIWQEIFENCAYKSGPNVNYECKGISDVLQERLKYYNSRYRKELRPTLSPGIDPKYEQ